jgi:hypothetical protein
VSRIHRRSQLRAELLDISELLTLVELGKIRVPDLHRAWRWDAKDICDLFDSLWRGIPIGTLMMWRRSADAEILTFGPVQISCPKRTDAWLVVDGHQRLITLVGVLLSSQDDPDFQPFNLYFDLNAETWHQSTGTAPVDPAWLPLRVAHNLVRTLNWARASSLSDERLKMAWEIREAILTTRVAITVVETEDPSILREVFFRINYSGKKPNLNESLHLHFLESNLDSPPNIANLRAELTRLGFGEVDDVELIHSVLLASGRNPTRHLARDLAQVSSPEIATMLRDARDALRQAVIFLQSEAGIPHKRLLPYMLALHVLTRFFAVYPDPSPRCRVLLTRWVWRLLTSEDPLREQMLAPRYALDMITGSRTAEQSAEALLDRLTQSAKGAIELSGRFDARTATARIQALALLTANPRSLVSGELLDVNALLSEHGARAFQHILSKPPPGMPEDLFRSIANRVFHPPIDEGDVLALLRAKSASPEQLASHDLPASLLDDPSDVAIVAALQARAVTLQRRVRDLVDLRCAWERPNRVSVSAILDEEDSEPEARTP